MIEFTKDVERISEFGPRMWKENLFPYSLWPLGRFCITAGFANINDSAIFNVYWVHFYRLYYHEDSIATE